METVVSEFTDEDFTNEAEKDYPSDERMIHFIGNDNECLSY